MVLRRIFKEGDDGLYYDTGKAMTAMGRVMAVEKQTEGGIPLVNLSKKTLFVNKNQDSMQLQKFNLPVATAQPAVLPVEDNYGQMSTFREEFGTVEGQRETIELTIVNSSAVANSSEEIIVGDGLNLVASKLGKFPFAPSGDIAIDGTYGTATLDFLKNISLNAPLRLHGFQIQSFDNTGQPNQNFFRGNAFRTLVASLSNRSLKDEAVTLSDLVKPNTFQTYLRENQNWRFLLAGYTAMIFDVPNGTTINAIFTLKSAGIVSGQKQQGTY